MDEAKHLHAELVASDTRAMAKHLRALADMIEAGPDSKGWSTSDVNGSSMAEWKHDPTPASTP